jgi:MOSC domain-containing protein YiiM
VAVQHRTSQELQEHLAGLSAGPLDHGTVRMIVRRPDRDEREVLKQAEVSREEGLVGDRWSKGDSPNPDTQLTLMNSTVIHFLAGSQDRWALAGDQLYIDLDLSVANLPAGTRLTVGSAVIEVTEPPHTGCAKFAERFGMNAARFVNSEQGRQLRLRGVNAKVIEPGIMRPGEAITRI